MLKKIYMWDPLVRVLHWALVISFTFTWIMGEFGPTDMTLHFIGGYATGVIVSVRIIWGLIGFRTARFENFVKSPRAIISYARRLPSKSPSHSYGHNPVGALYVIGVLALLLVHVGTGLISDPDDFINVGPFAHLVSYDATQTALLVHDILSSVLLLMVLVHIFAVIYYRLRKGENLVRAMVTGHTELPEDKHPK